MSLWRQLARGVRALGARRQVNAELDEEVRDYFERAFEDRVRAGLAPDEAARLARRELHEATRAHEALRSYGWEHAVEATFSDLRHALRRLRHSPLFSCVAVATLALGIGASTAIFSAVSPILLEPLPYPNAGRIVTLTDRKPDGTPADTTYGTFVEVAARSRSFERLAVADRWQPAIASDGEESERLLGDRVTADYFRVLGIAPAVGRDFRVDDEAIGGPQFAVVSDDLARRRFGGPRAILNETISLDGVPHTVVGVMPRGFENVLTPGADIWVTLQYRAQAPFESGEWGHHLRMIGRLASGISAEQAQQDIAALAAAPVEEFARPAWAALEHGLLVDSLHSTVTAGARTGLLAITAAVLLLLAIGCANVTNLLLARSIAQQGELAIRAALGAGRPRLVRQLLTENVLIALLGGLVGLGVAAIGVRTIVALAPPGLPRLDAIELDPAAIVFAFGLTTLVGLAVGLAPAVRSARSDVRAGLHSGLRATSGSHHPLRRVLVVAEVAIALVLLTGAGLLLRSVDRLLSTAPGFDASDVLAMQVVATHRRLEPDESKQRYFEAVLESVRGVPGVVAAAFTSQLPLSNEYDAYGVRFESDTLSYPSAGDGALRYVVTPDWFRTMGIPLLRGRTFGAQDRPDAIPAVVLSESFARRRFGDRDPIGERLRIGPENFEPDRPWDVVVGVVGDVKQASLGLDAADAFYMPIGQWTRVDDVQSLVVRVRGGAATLLPTIKAAIWSVDSAPPITRVSMLEELVAASESGRRFVLSVFALFAATALLLTGIGLFGVIAGSVAERTREIGLRAALGARPVQILALVMRQGLALASLGGAVGLIGAVVTTRGLASLLYGVTALDPATYATVVALLACVCAAACVVPAWRAVNVHPTIALRSE